MPIRTLLGAVAAVALAVVATMGLSTTASAATSNGVVRAAATLSGTTVVSGVSAAADDSKNRRQTGGVDLTPLWAGLGLLFAGGLLVTAAQSRRRITV